MGNFTFASILLTCLLRPSLIISFTHEVGTVFLERMGGFLKGRTGSSIISAEHGNVGPSFNISPFFKASIAGLSIILSTWAK